MRCEIIAIGTELLLGEIVDRNSSWIGQELALAGIDSLYQTKVGDNLVRITNSIRLALSRSDAVILCGGLGPTQDDITREAIAKVLGVPLVRDHKIEEKIRHLFKSLGREMAENNLRQADKPERALFIREMPGTAPGLICSIDDQVIYAVPGVPYEMKTMVKGTIISDLKRRAGVNSVISSRILRTWGRTESDLAELLDERIQELDKLGTATLAFQASGIDGLKIRITVKATDEAQANAILCREEQKIRSILGDCVFGTDDETMEKVVVDLLRACNMRLAIAELTTGGLLSARLSRTVQDSEVFVGSLVTTSLDEFQKLFRAPMGPPASCNGVMTIASEVRNNFSVDVGLAITSAASSGELTMSSNPVFFGLAIGNYTNAMSAVMPGDLNRVQEYSVITALNYLRTSLLLNVKIDE